MTGTITIDGSNLANSFQKKETREKAEAMAAKLADDLKPLALITAALNERTSNSKSEPLTLIECKNINFNKFGTPVLNILSGCYGEEITSLALERCELSCRDVSNILQKINVSESRKPIKNLSLANNNLAGNTRWISDLLNGEFTQTIASLTLKNCNLNNTALLELAKQPADNTNLQMLNLAGNAFSATELLTFLNRLPQYTKLIINIGELLTTIPAAMHGTLTKKNIILSGTADISLDNSQPLAIAMPSQSESILLEKMRFLSNDVYEEHLRLISENTVLKSLSIISCELSDKQAVRLLRVVGEKLEELHFSNNNFGEQTSWIEALFVGEINKTIKIIDVSGCYLSNNFLLHLGKKLEKNKTLQNLIISNNDFTPNGLNNFLKKVLKTDKSLKICIDKLDLQNSNINDDYLLDLATHIENGFFTKELNLSSNRLTYDGLKLFLKKLIEYKNIPVTEINLTGYEVLNTIIKQLMEKGIKLIGATEIERNIICEPIDIDAKSNEGHKIYKSIMSRQVKTLENTDEDKYETKIVLKNFDLGNVDCTLENVEYLAAVNIASRFNNITELSLIHCCLGDYFLQNTLHEKYKLADIEMLNLTKNPLDKPHHIDAIFYGGAAKKIKILILNECHLGDRSLIRLWENIKENATLNELNLSNNKFSPGVIIWFIKNIVKSQNTGITHIDLQGMDVIITNTLAQALTEKGITISGANIIEATSPEPLPHSNGIVSCEDIAADKIASTIKSIFSGENEIRSVSLCDCAINNDLLIVIATKIENLKNLSDLIIKGGDFSIKGLKIFFEILFSSDRTTKNIPLTIELNLKRMYITESFSKKLEKKNIFLQSIDYSIKLKVGLNSDKNKTIQQEKKQEEGNRFIDDNMLDGINGSCIYTDDKNTILPPQSLDLIKKEKDQPESLATIPKPAKNKLLANDFVMYKKDQLQNEELFNAAIIHVNTCTLSFLEELSSLYANMHEVMLDRVTDFNLAPITDFKTVAKANHISDRIETINELVNQLIRYYNDYRTSETILSKLLKKFLVKLGTGETISLNIENNFFTRVRELIFYSNDTLAKIHEIVTIIDELRAEHGLPLSKTKNTLDEIDTIAAQKNQSYGTFVGR